MFLLHLLVAVLIGDLLVAGEFAGDAKVVGGKPAYAVPSYSAVDCLSGAPQAHGLAAVSSLPGNVTANPSTPEAKFGSSSFPPSGHTAPTLWNELPFFL